MLVWLFCLAPHRFTQAELGKHSIGVGVYFASCKFVGFYVLFMGVFSLYTLFKSGLSNYHGDRLASSSTVMMCTCVQI